MQILTINIGSSSIKYQIFNSHCEQILKNEITGIGTRHGLDNHAQGIQKLAKDLDCEPQVICHRVVHGGDYFSGPAAIDSSVIEKISKLSDLAPLHNPIQLEAIKQSQKIFPRANQIAFFDTAFHQTMPESQRLIPINLGNEIKRYGFHGLNYAYINDILTDDFNRPVTSIICHLGNGASVCAIKDGKSYATSMGMTPNNGLIMGTRCGDIDSGVINYLSNKFGMSTLEIDRVLNNESGLKAITGSSDMRDCEEMFIRSDAKAELALEAFVQRIKFYIGGYMALTGAIDCLVFTGGIGENSALIRELVVKNMAGYCIDPKRNHKGTISTDNSIRIIVVPANEEKYMASWALKQYH